jgi:CDP-diacylglycerol--serine O-phosphatidyltransferase
MKNKYFNIPNTISFLNLLTGFAALSYLFKGELKISLVLITLTLYLDWLDGLAARKLKQTTEFGKQLDSFCDAINFCIYPSLSMLLILKIFWLIPIFYLFSGIFRLARFNVEGMGEEKQKSFNGMPTPDAFGILLLVFYYSQNLPNLFIYLVAPFLAILMVSNLRYPKAGLFTISIYLINFVNLFFMIIK